jgi:hypothetical protein
MGGYDITFKTGEEAKKFIQEIKTALLNKENWKDKEWEERFKELWDNPSKSITIQFDLEKEEVYLVLDW